MSKIGAGSIPSSGQSITGRVTGGGGVLAGRVVVGGAPVVVGQVIKSVPLVECWHCGTLADCSWETAYVLRWVHGSSEKYCALGGYVCYLDVEDSKSFILGGVSGSGLVEHFKSWQVRHRRQTSKSKGYGMRPSKRCCVQLLIWDGWGRIVMQYQRSETYAHWHGSFKLHPNSMHRTATIHSRSW